MIVCRKPFTLFDVDVIAIAALVVIALAAYFAVLRPAQGNAAEYRDLSAKIETANKQVAATSEKLTAVHAQTENLLEGVTLQSRAAPKIDVLNPFLRRITTLAVECGVTITQVVPRPVRRNDGYLSNDIFFTGTGGSLGFIRLLDRLACEHPYFTLEEYALKRAGARAEQPCEIAWTLRLYMLEEVPEPRKEGQP